MSQYKCTYTEEHNNNTNQKKVVFFPIISFERYDLKNLPIRHCIPPKRAFKSVCDDIRTKSRRFHFCFQKLFARALVKIISVNFACKLGCI